MRKGTEYARRLKKAYPKFRRSEAPSPPSEPTDPTEQLIISVLAQDSTVGRARKALKQIHEDLTDLNELRVSTPAEVTESIGRHISRSVERSKVLLLLLNEVYRCEYVVNLDSLKSKGIREVKQYLDSLQGSTPYVVASIILWSLGGHALPVNDPTLAWLVKNELVDARASALEVQAFLERHVSAADAKSFCLDLEAAATSRIAVVAGARKASNSSPKASKPKKKAKAASVARKSKTKGQTAAKKKKKTRR